MKLNQLGYIIQLLERHKLPATELIIKGKDSSRLSFTMAKRYYDRLNKMCVTYDLRLTVSHDPWLPKFRTRYHINIPTGVSS